MKKNYIKPFVAVRTSSMSSVIAASVYKVTNAAVDGSYNDQEFISDIDVDNKSTNFTQDANGRSDFGSESGPWESLW